MTIKLIIVDSKAQEPTEQQQLIYLFNFSKFNLMNLPVIIQA